MSVWRNAGEKGDMYNTTIRNSYKDEKSGEWKEISSFSPTDLAVVSQLSSQAFQAIGELKSQSRGRYSESTKERKDEFMQAGRSWRYNSIPCPIISL